MRLAIENILNAIDQGGEEELILDLSSFSCDINYEIQDYLLSKAIDFAKRKISITYLVRDADNGSLLGYFTLTHKALEISANGLSNSIKHKMARYAKLDKNNNSYTISAFLLAQFGKNFSVDDGKKITGLELMDCVDAILEDIQLRIGGSVVYLDCEDKKELIDFYAESAGFKLIGERTSDVDHIKYLQFFKFI